MDLEHKKKLYAELNSKFDDFEDFLLFCEELAGFVKAARKKKISCLPNDPSEIMTVLDENSSDLEGASEDENLSHIDQATNFANLSDGVEELSQDTTQQAVLPRKKDEALYKQIDTLAEIFNSDSSDELLQSHSGSALQMPSGVLTTFLWAGIVSNQAGDLAEVSAQFSKLETASLLIAYSKACLLIRFRDLSFGTGGNPSQKDLHYKLKLACPNGPMSKITKTELGTLFVVYNTMQEHKILFLLASKGLISVNTLRQAPIRSRLVFKMNQLYTKYPALKTNLERLLETETAKLPIPVQQPAIQGGSD